MKRIIITGASSGIGKEIALELADETSQFFLVARNMDRLEQVKMEIESKGSSAFIGVGDVSDEHQTKTLFSQAIAEMNGIDLLVANAGVGYFGNLEEMEISKYDDQFNTNVRGVFLWLREAIPVMRKQNSGQIIVTSSNLGLKTSPRASIYSATKHAVQAMVSSLRDELKGTMIKAATINPGSVSTPWFDGRDVDRSKMLTAKDVARAARLIVEQEETSNIDHILIMPGL
ncbi:MAG: SDR family oxidoreductase [Candidatus Thorarchaeota archaeon]|nr:SDR family oxidoreductase [Candidatus Thorarchaeota archaeon]